MFTIDAFTIIVCSAIIIAFILAWRYVSKTTEENVDERRKWLDQLPSIISTLGVLGTFLGITKGLLFFDTTDLDNSIPLLLDGLKTAFFTSLLGMAGSLFLNRSITLKLKNVNAAGDGYYAIAGVINNQNESLQGVMDSVSTSVNTISANTNQMKDDIEEMKARLNEMDSLSLEMEQLRAVFMTATASLAAIDNGVNELNDKLHENKNEPRKVIINNNAEGD